MRNRTKRNCQYCGTSFEFLTSALKTNAKKFCKKECLHNSRRSLRNRALAEGEPYVEELHGWQTRLFRTWSGMRVRCRDKTAVSYLYCGAKGIRVCQEWEEYYNFMVWAMHSGYTTNLTIDRIDNSKGYEPSNCRWATMQQQLRNTTKTKLDWGKVVKIRELVASGSSCREVGNMFGVTAGTVREIKTFRRWKPLAENGET